MYTVYTYKCMVLATPIYGPGQLNLILLLLILLIAALAISCFWIQKDLGYLDLRKMFVVWI
jgi:hypothetical protein